MIFSLSHFISGLFSANLFHQSKINAQRLDLSRLNARDLADLHLPEDIRTRVELRRQTSAIWERRLTG